jgi:uncharacterized membrane protein
MDERRKTGREQTMKEEHELKVIAQEIYELMQSKGITWREMDSICSELHELRKKATGFYEALKRLQELPL